MWKFPRTISWRDFPGPPYFQSQGVLTPTEKLLANTVRYMLLLDVAKLSMYVSDASLCSA